MVGHDAAPGMAEDVSDEQQLHSLLQVHFILGMLSV